MKQIFFSLLLYSSSMMSQNTGINTKTPGSNLAVNGSFAADYKIVTNNVTLDDSDFYIAYNGNTKGTILLPKAISGPGNFKGRIYRIKNTTSGWDLTVETQGLEKIDATGDVDYITIPPGYYAELISKGTTTGTTWELSMLVPAVPVPPSTVTKLVDVANSIARNTIGSNQNIFTIRNTNPGGIYEVTIPGSSNSFFLPEPKTVFLDFAVGIDDLGAYQWGRGSISHYYRCELYIDGVATGLFQVVQQNGMGTQLQFSLSGVRNLPAGTHTIHAEFSLWLAAGTFNFGANFGVLSLLLSAVYIN